MRVQTRPSSLKSQDRDTRKDRKVARAPTCSSADCFRVTEILPFFSLSHRSPSDHHPSQTNSSTFHLASRAGGNAFSPPSRAGSSVGGLDGCRQGWCEPQQAKLHASFPKCQHEAKPLGPSFADPSRPRQCLRRSLAVSPASPRLCDILFPMTMVKANETWGMGRLTPVRPRNLSLGFCSVLQGSGDEFLSTIAVVLQDVAVISSPADGYRRASGSRHASNGHGTRCAGRSVRGVLSQLGIWWYVLRFAPKLPEQVDITNV